jgi:hypothetical protein
MRDKLTALEKLLLFFGPRRSDELQRLRLLEHVLVSLDGTILLDLRGCLGSPALLLLLLLMDRDESST